MNASVGAGNRPGNGSSIQLSGVGTELQAITLIIGTLQGARVFSEDNYDTLITKAALHGAKLLKKPHQATAVNLASHLWWQEMSPEEDVAEEGKETEKKNGTKEEGEKKAVSICLRCQVCCAVES